MVEYIDLAQKVSLFNVMSAVGAIMGFFLFYQRNKIFEKQLLQKDKHYLKDSQFQNFLDASKMLTENEASVEAKISALYLLYDLATNYPSDTERILQVINQQIIFLIKILETEAGEDIYKKQEIIEWEYKGDDIQKIVASALKIIKKVSLLDNINTLEYSTSVIFNIDTRYDKNINSFIDALKKKNAATKNLIFYHCSFSDIDFSFTIFHYCKFIKCDIVDCTFNDSNLWGTQFLKCNLDKTVFSNAESEGTEFKNCYKLTKSQIGEMIFQNLNKNSNKKALVILEKNVFEEIECFRSELEYKNWKSKIRT